MKQCYQLCMRVQGKESLFNIKNRKVNKNL